MCLAKAYLRPPDVPETDFAKGTRGSDEDLLVMENVTQVEVEGRQVHLRSLLGDSETLHGHVVSIDFAEGRLLLQA